MSGDHDCEVVKTPSALSESSSKMPLLSRIIEEAGMKAVVGTIKSTFSVIFVRHPSSTLSYAVKIFPLTLEGRNAYAKESLRNSMVS